MKKGQDSLRFEIVEVPAQQGRFDELLDFVADLLIRKWMEEREEDDAGRCDLRS